MLEPGEVFDRYRVESLLGEGGMAAVYRVRHTGLSSLFAMKVLKVEDLDVRVRLEKEARVQSALRHPNIVAINDVIDVRGAPALVMELVEGPTLAEFCRGRRLSFEEIDTLYRPIIGGVGFAHHKGLVHRDLKPGNILMAPGDEAMIPKIADFGLAKLLSDEMPAITRSDVAMGTPAYMAPEQIQNPREVDQRADLFALGCILYELCTGQRPFKGENPYAVLYAVMGGKFISPDALRRDLPPRFADTIRLLLQTNPDDRIQSCTDLKGHLWADRPSAPGGVRATPPPRIQFTVTNSETSLPQPTPVAITRVEPPPAPAPAEAPRPVNEDLTEPFGAPLQSRIGNDLLPADEHLSRDDLRSVVAVQRPDLQARISQTGLGASPAPAPRPIWPWVVAGVTLVGAAAAMLTIAVGGTAVAVWRPWASPPPQPVSLPQPALSSEDATDRSSALPVAAPVLGAAPAPPVEAPKAAGTGTLSVMFMSTPAPGSAVVRCEDGYTNRQVVAGGRAVWPDVPTLPKCSLTPNGLSAAWEVHPGENLSCLTDGDALVCS